MSRIDKSLLASASLPAMTQPAAPPMPSFSDVNEERLCGLRQSSGDNDINVSDGVRENFVETHCVVRA
jgi:hypothetical protein